MSCWRRFWDYSYNVGRFAFTLSRQHELTDMTFNNGVAVPKISSYKIHFAFVKIWTKKLKDGSYFSVNVFTFFSMWCNVSNILPFFERFLCFYFVLNVFAEKFPSGQ